MSTETTAPGELAHPMEMKFFEDAGMAEQSISSTIISIALPVEQKIVVHIVPELGRLKAPLRLSLQTSEGCFMLASEELDIVESGSSFEEALNAFYAFFKEDGEHWRSSDVDRLTPDAVRLRERFLSYLP